MLLRTGLAALLLAVLVACEPAEVAPRSSASGPDRVASGSASARGEVASETAGAAQDLQVVRSQVEAAIWRFHAADTARDAQGVIDLLWPEYEMLVDGARTDYQAVVSGTRSFMASLDLFHTEWSDLRVTPLSGDFAVSSFFFRDSIVTSAGELIQARGPTTLVWEQRGGIWKMRFGDADHYPLASPR